MKFIELKKLNQRTHWIGLISDYTHIRESVDWKIGQKKSIPVKPRGIKMQEIQKIIREIDSIGRDSDICITGVLERQVRKK